ncbi:MAG: response regulator [Bacteroidales bacterium]|nr:response regulator [Bacteroidales bacterium]
MNKKIFFVDDDKMIINLLEYTFQSRQQYEVISFDSGEACLKALAMNPDLIVLDHELSGLGKGELDGLQTLEEIKSVNENIPVVVLTGYGTDELYQEFLKRGAERFLTKDDYFIDSLIDTINDVLQ